MYYHEIMMINHHTNEVHTASRLKAQCNIANPEQTETEHVFKLIGCTSEGDLLGKINYYLQGHRIHGQSFTLCQHCFLENKLTQPCKIEHPIFEDIAFKNILTNEVHTASRLVPSCSLTQKPTELSKYHHFIFEGYSEVEENEVLDQLTNDNRLNLCPECFPRVTSF